MEVRPIKPEEKIQFSKLLSIAFLSKKDFSEHNNSDKNQQNYEYGRAVFDSSGKMCSGMEVIPYNVHYDGKTVLMGGIANVATLPEERKKGYIRKLFKYSIEEMYEKGYVFSFLYPFSYEYYRKFGYELNLTFIECTIPFSLLQHFQNTGSAWMFVPGKNSTDIMSIYNKYIQDKNLSVVREKKNWERFLENDPYKTNVYLYVWLNKEGNARGYFQFCVERNIRNGYHEQNMRINEFIWLDGEAFAGMLAFISNLAPQFHKLILRIPHFVDILSFFPEPRKIELQIRAQGMNRIVNVQKALETMKVPSGKGEAVIEVIDTFITRNTGRYLVVWEGGRSEVTTCNLEPDAICEVNILSQLVTGFASIPQLQAARKVKINGNYDELNRLFYKKDLFLNDYF